MYFVSKWYFRTIDLSFNKVYEINSIKVLK